MTRFRRTDIGDEIESYFAGLGIGRAALANDPDFAPAGPVLANPFDDQLEWNAEMIGMWDSIAEIGEPEGGCFA